MSVRPTTASRSVFFVAMLLNLGVLGGHCLLSGQLTAAPSIHDDHIDYDSLGWEWSQGRGYQLHLTETSFRTAYTAPGLDEHAAAVGADEPWSTASRPPLFPFLLAAGNKFFGRQFWFGRSVNLIAIAIACGLLATLAFRLAGTTAAVVAWMQFTLIDVRVRITSREFLTEAISVLVVAGLLCCLIRWYDAVKTRRDPTDTDQDDRSAYPTRWLVVSGVVLGVGMLLRTAFVLWLPVLVAMLIWLGGKRCRSSYTGAAVFALLALVVLSPWMVRNVAVLDSFQPLGTMGARDSYAAYSDRAIQTRGQWFSLLKSGFFDELDPETRGLQAETARGALSSAKAKEWILSNPHKLPLLAVLRVMSEIRPRQLTDLYILAFAVLGGILYRRSDEVRLSLGLILACLFGIAITWSVAGRFVFPILVPIHLLAALAAAHAWKTAIQGVPNQP